MQQFLKNNSILKNALILLLFLVVCFAMYFPILKSDPMWDDWVFIFKSRTLRNASFWEFWIWGDYRRSWPMFYTALSVMFKLWKENVLYYHLTSIFLHTLNAFILYRFLKRVGGFNSFIIALIYLIHPANFFTVSWIIQIKTLLAIFFFGISLNFFFNYLNDSKKWKYWCSVLFWGMSLLSKAVFAPVILFLFFYKDKRKVLPFVFLVLYSSGLTFWTQYVKEYAKTTNVLNLVISPAVSQDNKFFKQVERVQRPRPLGPAKLADYKSPFENVAISLKNLVRYSIFTLLPGQILLIHPYTKFDYNYIDFAIISMFLIMMSYVLVKFFETKNYYAFAGLTFFIITIYPLCGTFYIPIFHYSNFIDYWLSVPLLGIALCLSSFSNHKMKYFLVIIFLAFSFNTYKTARDYTDPVKIITTSSENSPNHPLVKLILAKHYFFQGYFAKSNAVLLNVRKSLSVEKDKIDQDINTNLKAMNGEEIDEFTL